MDKYQETFETWNKVAKAYQDKFMEFTLYNDTYKEFLNQIPTKSASVLDVGCGPGNITKYLLTNNPGLRITAIDFSPSMVQLAQTNNPTATAKVVDTREISSLSTKYDAITSGFCIPYLSKSDCSKFIRDCYNLLNHRGILYLSFVEGVYKNSKYLTGSGGNRLYFYYYDLHFIKEQLKKHSFKELNVIHKYYTTVDGTEETHTIIISQKE